MDDAHESKLQAVVRQLRSVRDDVDAERARLRIVRNILENVATELEGNEKLEAPLADCRNAMARLEHLNLGWVAAIVSLDEYVRQITGYGHDDSDRSSNGVQDESANDIEALHGHQATRYLGLAPSWARLALRQAAASYRVAAAAEELGAVEPSDDPLAFAAGCETFAWLAKGVLAVADPVKGANDIVLGGLDANFRTVLISPAGATVFTLFTAYAKTHNLRTPPGEELGEALVDYFLDSAVPGVKELKLLALLLRTCGMWVCLTAPRPMVQCDCLRDLLTDGGTGIIEELAR